MNTPGISVVIPCFNAGRTIGELLSQLGRQTLSPDRYEIIVVDDGSTDNTREVVRCFPAITLLEQSRRGPGIARMLGAERAQGDYILYLDSDLYVPENLLEAHLEYHLKHPAIAATGGGVEPSQEWPLFSWPLVDYFSSWFNAHPEVVYRKPPEYLPSLNFCINRKLLVETRPLHWEDGLHHTGEDVVFCHAIRQRGLQIAFVPEAKVKHEDRRTFRAYLRHMYRWGFHAPYVRGKLSGLKYGFLFPHHPSWLLLTLPLIIIGYTVLIWISWRGSRFHQATLCLPQILIGRLAYAWGVVRGTFEKNSFPSS